MQTNSLILIIVLGFVALWLVTRNEEHMNGGLDSTTRLAAGGLAGPRPWAPALINARNRADGSPCHVPFDWFPHLGRNNLRVILAVPGHPANRANMRPICKRK